MRMFQPYLMGISLVSMVGLLGCSPTVNTAINVERLPISAARPLQAEPFSQIQVNRFKDVRRVHHIGQFEGRTLFSAGDPLVSVQRALEEELVRTGMEISYSDGPRVEGLITRWELNIADKFPSSYVEAVAGIEVFVLSPELGRVYRARYFGSATIQDISINQQKVEEVYGKAMRFALQEVARDRAFLDAVGKFADRVG